MGMANSRVLTSGTTTSSAPLAWHSLQCGVHYSRDDVRLWTHLEPMAQWFTAQDARRLLVRLMDERPGSTGLLTLREFLQWLGAMSSGDGILAIDKSSEPTSSREDIMTPPSRRGNQVQDGDSTPTVGGTTALRKSPSLLEKHLQHVFLTFATRAGGRMYAFEFLAALVVVSRAIWDFHEKLALLIELFHDPAASSSKSSAYASAQRLKETDVARLLLCVMNGVGRATQGISRVWETHDINTAALARQSASHCVQSLMGSRTAPVNSLERPNPAWSGDECTRSVSSKEFSAYVVRTPALREFLALFSGEELRNPLTFAPVGPSKQISRHNALYESLLRRYVVFDGRHARRETSAALLIQSTWRRRCSLSDLSKRAQARVAHRHASAARLQGFIKTLKAARELEARAEEERAALNGGVFAAGVGPSVIESNQTRRNPIGKGGGAPVRLLSAFSRLNVKLTTLAASATCAVGVGNDKHSLYAWGRCLPRRYAPLEKESVGEDLTSFCLTHAIPRRLLATLTSPVLEVSCGLRHALVLTEDGMVFSWGFNDHGQLGHGSADTLLARTDGRVRYEAYYDERSGDDELLLATPTQLLYFQGCEKQQAAPIPVAQICCGDYYSLALSRAGDVFAWGEASEGQLGLGDSHDFFEVALADRRMASSAYTFLAQPEPVLALSDVRVTQIACRGNHSVALSGATGTQQSRLFEWGNWGRRRGVDSEHAFLPEELHDVSELRLRRVAVGDHHTLAEGASVWLRLVNPPTVLQSEEDEDTGFYLELLAGSSNSLDAIEREFVNFGEQESRSWTCCLVDLDADDVGEDEDGDAPRSPPASRPVSGDAKSLWQRRAARFTLSIDQVVDFDQRTARLLTNANNTPQTYAQRVDRWLRGRVSGRLAVMPRGKPAGFYLQFRLPLSVSNGSQAAPIAPILPEDATEEARSEDESIKAALNGTSGVVLELAACGSNTAARAVGRRGFATHTYHPAMAAAAKRLKQQQLRARSATKKKPTAALTETNSLFVLEIDEQTLASMASKVATASEDDIAVDETEEVVGALPTASEAELEAENIVSEIGHRVLELQEAGALAVLVVLDLFEADAFVLQFAEESGIFIPVFMVTRSAQATVVASYGALEPGVEREEGDWGPREVWTVQEILEHVLTSPTTLTPATPSASPPQRPSVHSSTPSLALRAPPPLMVRCFYRADTAAIRARGAFANGAAGVLFVEHDAMSVVAAQRAETSLKRSLEAILPTHTKRKHQLVALLSYQHGQRLRAASRLTRLDSPQQRETPRRTLSGSGSSSSATTNCELVVDVQFELRAGGTTYAWGEAENGRLGLGNVSVQMDSAVKDAKQTIEEGSPLFQDGYEAFTDCIYSFVATPTRVRSLAGIELRQIAAGSAHSVAVTTHGKVFSWGRGARGQLGHAATTDGTSSSSQPSDEWTPRLVRGLRYERVAQVATTDRSSLFLSETVAPEVYEKRRRQAAQLRALVRQTQDGTPQTDKS